MSTESDLREALEDMVWEFAYRTIRRSWTNYVDGKYTHLCDKHLVLSNRRADRAGAGQEEGRERPI